MLMKTASRQQMKQDKPCLLVSTTHLMRSERRYDTPVLKLSIFFAVKEIAMLRVAFAHGLINLSYPYTYSNVL